MLVILPHPAPYPPLFLTEIVLVIVVVKIMVIVG